MTEDNPVATLPIETFQDADLSLEVKRLPACTVEMLVTVTPSFCQKAYAEAIKQVGESASLPGFRKGKVPADQVKQNFAKDIDKQWRQQLGSIAGTKAIELSGIRPSDPTQSIQFQLRECTVEKGGTLILRYETIPADIALDPAALQIPTCEITDELQTKARERMLDSLKLFVADWEPVTDRPVAENDFVDIDVDLQKDQPQSLYNERRFSVSEQMPSWLRKLVIGKNIGDVFEAQTELDERAPPSAKEHFVSVPVKVTVRAISTPKLPPVDDELVKKLGMKSMEQMHEVIEQQANDLLQRMRQHEREAALRRQLNELLVFEVPKSLVEKELRFQISQLIARMTEEQRKSLSQDQVQGEAQRRLPEAVHIVRLLFLGQQLLREKAIEMSEADLNALFQRVLADHVKAHGEPKKEQVEGLLQHLRGVTMSQALLQETLKYLLEHGQRLEQVHPFV